MMREAIEIELHPNNMNREDGLCLSRSWKPLIHAIKERNPPHQRSKLSQLSFSGQHRPLFGLSLLTQYFPASSRWPAEQAANLCPLSLLHYTSPSLPLWLPPLSTISPLPRLIVTPLPIGLIKFPLDRLTPV
jgi:hypothetical protein